MLTILFLMNAITAEHIENIPIILPKLTPARHNVLMARAFKIDTPQYIIGYEPRVSPGLYLHMALFGCKLPGFNGTASGTMSGQEDIWEFMDGNACKKESHMSYPIFAWTSDTQPFNYDKG